MKPSSERQYPYEIAIKMGTYEVRISGSREEVLRTIDNLADIVNKVSEAFRAAVPPTLANPPATVAPVEAAREGYPIVSQKGSCCDVLLQLLDSDWGRKSPRTLGQVVEALKANAIHYPVATVAKSLERLVKRGKLRRWKDREGYVYTMAT
jgi:hypothetical protein